MPIYLLSNRKEIVYKNNLFFYYILYVFYLKIYLNNIFIDKITELIHKAISPTIFVTVNIKTIETITKQMLYINKTKLINSDFFLKLINSKTA